MSATAETLHAARLKPDTGAHPLRDVAVAVRQREAALSVSVPGRNATRSLVSIPRDDAGGGQWSRARRRRCRGGGARGERLRVEQRPARAVVEVGEAGGGQRQPPGTRGEAARATASARPRRRPAQRAAGLQEKLERGGEAGKRRFSRIPKFTRACHQSTRSNTQTWLCLAFLL
jgi:hypothetical protein